MTLHFAFSQPETVPEHVGLWLDRCYLPERDKEKPGRRALYEKAIRALRMGQPAVATYRVFFQRWKSQMLASDSHRRIVEIEATSRVLLHPATNASITDGSILLHHTYGVPYLPGSGLKGIARACMRKIFDAEHEARKAALGEDWKKLRSDARDSDLVRALFGRADSESAASAIEFLDALWVPEPPKGADPDWSPLALDVINPHQSEYYMGDGPPADWNEPIPTQRLTVRPGTRFCVVVEGIRADKDVSPWMHFAVDELLRPALANMGFGAWTSAGYGRFETKSESPRATAERKVQSVAVNEQWYTVVVELDPGSGTLKAKTPEGRVAEVRNPKAQALRNALPDDVRERLKKKRALQLQVQVEPVGNALQIVGLKPV